MQLLPLPAVAAVWVGFILGVHFVWGFLGGEDGLDFGVFMCVCVCIGTCPGDAMNVLNSSRSH